MQIPLSFLGYSELIDSHRAGLQMESGFLTVFLGPAWGHMTSSLPPSGPLTKPFFTQLARKYGDDGEGPGARGRGAGLGGSIRQEAG